MNLLRLFLNTGLALCFAGAAAHAKGLDDIQPTDKNESPAEGNADTAKPGSQAQPGNTGQPAAAQAAQAAQAPMVQSATSKKLSEKLHLSASYGFVRIPKAEIGEMSAQGMADLSALWNFIDDQSRNIKVMLTFRYAPMHSENLIDGQSYKSIIEGYHVGGQYRYRFLHKDLELMASAELGYLLVYQESRDKYPVQENSENNELAYTVGTGFEWVLMDKVSVGPRFYAGFGSIQIVQASGSVTFAF